MKKLLILVALMHIIVNINAQSLTKNSQEAEEFISSKLSKLLFTKLKSKVNPREVTKLFSVRFELNQSGEPQNILFSVNMKDTLIINMVKSVLTQSQAIWDIEKCKKYNPSLYFLLPIRIDMYSKIENKSKRLIEKTSDMVDFTSLIKFSPIDRSLEFSFAPAKEKFTGLVLSPILIDNSQPFE